MPTVTRNPVNNRQLLFVENVQIMLYYLPREIQRPINDKYINPKNPKDPNSLPNLVNYLTRNVNATIPYDKFNAMQKDIFDMIQDQYKVWAKPPGSK